MQKLPLNYILIAKLSVTNTLASNFHFLHHCENSFRTYGYQCLRGSKRRTQFVGGGRRKGDKVHSKTRGHSNSPLAAVSRCSAARTPACVQMCLCVLEQLFSPCSPVIVTTARKQLKRRHEKKLLPWAASPLHTHFLLFSSLPSFPFFFSPYCRQDASHASLICLFFVNKTKLYFFITALSTWLCKKRSYQICMWIIHRKG